MENKGHSIDECPLREKIENNHDRSKDNKRKIEQLVKGDWYSNQQLFEMIQDLQSNITALNESFKKYFENRKEDRELIEKLDGKYSDIEKELNDIKKEKDVKKETAHNWREWIGWAVAILLALSKLGVF